MTVTIRPACFPADLATVRTLMTEYIASLQLDLSFQDVDAEMAALPGFYVPPRGALLLAEHGGAAVGIGAMRPLADGSIEMKRMYVCPAARGLGAGRALAAALVAAAWASGAPLMRLDTQRDFTAAVALYRSLGFTETPRYNDNPLPGALFMALDLAAAPA